MTTPNIFLLGYGGANNTGAEIRILTIIDDIRATFGAEVPITLGTVDREKTQRVVGESPHLDIVQLPYIFPLAVWRLAKKHDIVVLVEGSTFKDNWSSALLYLFLWGAWTAGVHGNRSIAYAVDAGKMSGINQRLTRWVCNRMDLIITRTEAAREQLKSLGVTKKIAVTTDTAFQFERQMLGKSETPVVGIAPVEFYKWPVRFRLWGPAAQCYHWPYYFSWDESRAAQSAALVDAWVDLIRHIVDERGWSIRLIAMEELDTEICGKILDRLPDAVRVKVETSFAGKQTPQAIVGGLRELNYLVTSRYHACVLSMGGRVPQMALYHDERLISIYREMGLEAFAIPHHAPDLSAQLHASFETLVHVADTMADTLQDRLQSYYMPRCLKNRQLLREWHDGLADPEDAA
jgi:polysaccharide pyruvyl transferase WcaK-like protein